MEATTFPFPETTIDPRLKNKDWIFKFIKAAWGTSKNFYGKTMYFGCDRLTEVRSYGLGMASVLKYMQQRTGEQMPTDSYDNVDYTYVDYASKYRNIAVAKIRQQSFDVRCDAVDPLSKSEQDATYNAMKAKIALRQAAQEAGSELANSPLLKPAPNEPQDMEQLEMEMQYNYKHTLAMEAELGVQWVQEQSNFEEQRKRAIEDSIDWGIGALTNYIDENGNIVDEHVDIRELVLSPFFKRDGSDITYWGRVRRIYLGTIAYYFKPDELKKIGEAVKGKNGNPMKFNYATNDWSNYCMVYVFDCKFKSFNSTAYEERVDNSGNIRFGKTDFKNFPTAGMEVGEDGSLSETEDTSQPKYYGQTTEVVYKAKWIIDTPYLYDYGLSENMVRKNSDKCHTSLDLQIYSWNFDRGKFSGLTEKLLPFQDQICLTWYKMQNFVAKMIPYIMKLDASALENISYGKGGAENKPEEIINFVLSNFALLYRSKDLLDPRGNTQPLDPVSIEPTGDMASFGLLREQMLFQVDQMRQITGLNELTDGSTPNAKMLTTPANSAIQATNNALDAIMFADQQLVQMNAESIVLKLQILVKLGKVEGYTRTMGDGSLKFMQISPDLGLRDFGITCKVMPSYEERQLIWQQATSKESQGLLDITDMEMIMSTKNIKLAMMLLSYRIKKRKEELQQQEIAKIQENNQGQQQMIVVKAQAEQQTIQMQLQADLMRIEAEMKWQYQIAAMSKQMDYNSESVQVQGRIIGHNIQKEAKENSAMIAAHGGIIKQSVANKKSKAKA